MKNTQRGSVFSAIGRGAKRLTEPLRQSIFNAYREDGDGRASSRRNILAQNILFNATATITGGIFLTGLILIILKDEPQAVQNQYLGLIISMQLLANVSQIIVPFLIHNMKSYRIYGIVCRVVYYTVNVLLLGLVPILPMGAQPKAIIFVVLVVILQIASVLPNPALMRWHIVNIPDPKRPDWFSIQQMTLPICNAVASLIASVIIDKFELAGAQLSGILVIRGLALLLVFFELRTHGRIKEDPYPDSGEKIKPSSVFLKPFSYRPFMTTVLIVVLWNFVANLPGQYFNAYILGDLKVSYTFVNLCSATNIPLMLIAMPLWNKFVRRNGWLKSLGTALGLYVLPYLLNNLMFNNTIFLYLISVMYCNVISPGINLSFANLPYLRMPEENQTSCLAFYQAAAGVAAFAGSFIGRAFINMTEGLYIPIFGQQIQNRQYICLISATVLICLAIFVLAVARKDKKKKS